MKRIKLLSKDIWDKIAAGEVIESPISVVKELVENSIDAGSTQIVIEIAGGGKDYIRVSDNGSGIEKEDLKLSILPHATSKIESVEDLSTVLSLGFRGEALASIAAVSRLEIKSKTEGSNIGHSIYVEGSDILGENECALDAGTTIIVKDLFFNLPARRKFLKSDNKESSFISEFISKIALCYPDIRIRFINNGTIMFSTPGKGDLHQTILTVYGTNNTRKLLPVAFDRDNIKITGYVSSPLESRVNKKQQIFFVNGRLIQSSILDSALSLAYKDKLFEGRFPSAYLFIEVNPNTVDVNIHPRKAEIKFYDEETIQSYVIDAVRDALLDKNATKIENTDIKDRQISKYVAPEVTSDNRLEFKEVNITSVTEEENKANLFEELRSIVKDTEEVKPQKYVINEDTAKEIEVQEEIKISSFESKPDRLYFSRLTPISQIFTTYILCSDNESLYIIDQHAAHERVMYEKLMNQFNNDSKASQLLLMPIVIDLDASKLITAYESIKILTEMGFVIEEFGPNTFIVKEIPYFISDTEASDFVNEFFDTADNLKGSIQLRKNEIISKSCKSAVKAHDKLSFNEMIALFKEMDNCENPYSCPHGRPTFIKFTESELEKIFLRK